MTKLVLLHKAGSIYDDVPEERYHFPNGPYLKAMREAIGDWIVYYEPLGGGARRGGRQAYFAVARIDRLEVDPQDSDNSYAFVADYQEFAQPVSLHDAAGHHFERRLEQPDGSTNAGLRQRAVRRISDAEFTAIVQAGMRDAELDVERDEQVGLRVVRDQNQEPFERPIVESILRRPLRNAAFRRAVLAAYESTCAFTSICVINGGGRAEVDAAHIRPVGDNHRGSDSIRNGLALSKTIHWLFDRGILAVDDQHRILESPGRLPSQLRGLMNGDGRLRLPDRQDMWPHRENLAYHRRMFEDEYGKFRLLS